jgi:anti-sigma B factor antagonist
VGADPGVRIVALAGEHDLSTAAELGEALARALAESSSVVIDLSAVTFVDSSVVGVLVDAQRRAATLEGRGVAVVAPPRGAPARLLDLMGAHRLVRVFESREAARAAGLGAPCADSPPQTARAGDDRPRSPGSI